MKSNSIREAWLVIVLAISFGMALAAVHGALSPKISENKTADTLRQVPALVPGAVRGEAEDRAGRVVYRAIEESGRTVGWVIPQTGRGFSDKITALVGTDPEGKTVLGVYILQQRETPGLGDRIRTVEFRNRFRGCPTHAPLIAVKSSPQSPVEIEGVTGATVSSKSVVAIVNQAIEALRQTFDEPGNTQP